MKTKGTILIVDDDKDVLFTAKTILKNEFENILVESSPNRLETLLRVENIDIVILDMNFKIGSTSGNEGLYWLQKIKEISPDVDVLMNTAYGDIDLAVKSMKLGAMDYLVKPWEVKKLISTVKNAFQLRNAQRKVAKLEQRENVLIKEVESNVGELLYTSQAMKDLMKTVEKVAPTDASILISGENGTGKDVLARTIHRMSKRAKDSMLKVDIGSISENLFESEMFGHVKGAFTDAVSDKVGRFELADGSSLFLDEIGNIPVNVQSKLLTVLQNRIVSRVGSNKEIPFDVRVISATNMPIPEMVNTGEFRQDLLYRINTVELEIPPLRKRKEDIPLIANHYLKLYGEKYLKHGFEIDELALKELVNYKWPGNIRELQHAIERAVIMSNDSVLYQEDFLLPKRANHMDNDSLKVVDVERQAISEALDKFPGNLSRAASELGIGRTTLYRKMKKYDIS